MMNGLRAGNPRHVTGSEDFGSMILYCRRITGGWYESCGLEIYDFIDGILV
jgi:hypothetical protein